MPKNLAVVAAAVWTFLDGDDAGVASPGTAETTTWRRAARLEGLR